MCGLAGFFNRNGAPADEGIVQRMMSRLSHRGPDDQGCWTDGPTGLGLCRLSVMDPTERGHQPFVTAKGVLIYNGEVYNFRDLRRELEALGRTFHGTSDTEVVAQALSEWGAEKAVPRFNGMFALAWYQPESNTLWLARDRAGIKPLYLADVGGVIAFASEAKALFAHPQIRCRADMHTLTTHVFFHRLAGEWTPFESVRSLQPGTLRRIDAAGQTETTFFDLIRDLEPDRIVCRAGESVEGLADEFESIFCDSVRSQLVSDAPIGLLCSGGVDSSLLTAVASKELRGLPAYVADIESAAVSEADKAQKVCRHVGADFRPVPFSREDFFREWADCVYHNDEPLYFPFNLPARVVFRQAQRDGLKVLLGGEGADELFGGYHWQASMYRHGQRYQRSRALMRLLPGLRRFGQKMGQWGLAADARRLTRLPYGMPDALERSVSSDARGWALDGGQRSFRRQAFFDRLDSLGHMPQQAFLAQSFEDFHSQLRTTLRNMDKMAMSQSIETRVPFLDSRLIDFGLHAPFHAKFSRGEGKRVVKRAAEKWLPREIIYAKKIGFGVNSCVWTGAEGLLRDGVVAELFKWDRRSVDQIHADIAADPGAVFQLVSTELWARIFLRGESPADLGEQLLELAAG